MSIRVILMDVDGTMTGYKKSGMVHRSPLYLLETLVMGRFGMERTEASRKILSCGDCEIYCLSEFLEQLQISREEYFKSLVEDLANYIYITEDTKRFFRFLKAERIPLYTATTNSEFMTKAKLAAGGEEADIDGCRWLTGFYPGCFFRDPRGKFSPDYYSSILKHGGFAPESIMMIGDEPEHDMLPAMEAGIRYGVNINREQEEPLLRKDGGYWINSLDVLQEVIIEVNNLE